MFDIFPTTFFAHGEDEVRRRVMVRGTPLACAIAVPMVSAEDSGEGRGRRWTTLAWRPGQRPWELGIGWSDCGVANAGWP
jgi:hypothetical protein